MADYLCCYTGPQDVQVEFAGKGHLAGVVVTCGDDAIGACELYDYAGAGPPGAAPIIYVVAVNKAYQVTHLFNDRYAPRFHDGLWLHLSDHCYAMLWAHFPETS